jgi:Skp family chaperone for outer membrane proteins
MRFLSIASAVAIAASVLLVTPDAFAQRNRNNQAASAVVINYQRVVAESALGRDMAAKLQVVNQQIGQELQGLAPEGQSIEQESNRLQAATRNMTAEQVRANATYRPQFEALAQRLQTFQQRRNALQGDAECSQLLALRDFDRLVTPIVRSVMESRGAGVVLDAGSIQLASPDMDITNTVIQQLDANAGTRTANATRQPVTACQTQQAPQQQPPAQ